MSPSPLINQVAAVSAGFVDGELMLDLAYAEDSIADRFLYDTVNGLHWTENTAAQRVTSAISIDPRSLGRPGAKVLSLTSA